MNLKDKIQQRSDNTCELCGNTENLSIYTFEDFPEEEIEGSFIICSVCKEQFENPEKADPNHWRCLNDSMWSSVPAVQVAAWRMLNHLRAEGWPQDLLDMMYLDDENMEWAKASGDHEGDGSVDLHKDSNGNILVNGDTVTLIKDLDVKGSSINAKIGTAVRNIRLVHDNTEQIEGKVDGQLIVILTKFVKKQA